MTLAEFVLARIADTEQRCGAWHETNCDAGVDWEDRCSCGLPVRILLGCAAQRQVVTVLAKCADATFTVNPVISALALDALRILGAIDIDHPDYDHHWAPNTELIEGQA